jgi:hypothetical protein
MVRIADLCVVHARRQVKILTYLLCLCSLGTQLAQTYPWLKKYEHSWPTLELLKQNLHSCKRRITNAKKRLAAAAESEFDGEPGGQADGELSMQSDGESEIGFESSDEE